jgi:hypothetical protein
MILFHGIRSGVLIAQSSWDFQKICGTFRQMREEEVVIGGIASVILRDFALCWVKTNFFRL